MGFDAAMVSKAGQKVRKPSVEFLFMLFFRFLGQSTLEKTIEPKKAGFDAALVSKAGRKVQKPIVEFLFLLFFSLSEQIVLGENN